MKLITIFLLAFIINVFWVASWTAIGLILKDVFHHLKINATTDNKVKYYIVVGVITFLILMMLHKNLYVL